MKTQNGRPKDTLTTYSNSSVALTTISLIDLLGGVEGVVNATGLSKSVIYAVKSNVIITEKTATRIMSLAAAIEKASNGKPKEVKPKDSKPKKQDLTELSIAHKYCIKADNAKNNGHEFALTFEEYKSLLLQPHCYYTDVLMSRNTGELQIDTDMTLDRVDNHLGYVDGNVVACCYAANQLKAFVENPKNSLNVNGALMVLNRTKEFMNNMEIK